VSEWGTLHCERVSTSLVDTCSSLRFATVTFPNVVGVSISMDINERVLTVCVLVRGTGGSASDRPPNLKTCSVRSDNRARLVDDTELLSVPLPWCVVRVGLL